jgi:aspartate ammonia-lyase
MPAAAWNVLHFLEILKNMVHAVAAKGVKGNSARGDRCRHCANATIGITSTLNSHTGYRATTEIRKKNVKTGRPLADIAPERNLFDEGMVRNILDSTRMTAPMVQIKQALPRARRESGRG